jgi:hypothetical protein
MPKRTLLALALLLIGIIVPGCIWLDFTTETDYKPPKDDAEDGLADDRLDDKPTPPFDAQRVDRRPLDGWRLNASAAVVRLDVPPAKPDKESDLLTLHPSYAATAAARPHAGACEVLPSVSLLDGKAKQFDDGLYAALDRAYYRGLNDRLRGHVQLIRRFYERIGKDSPAAAFLAAGLELAGVHVEATDVQAKNDYLSAFRNDEVASKPIGFYTWNRELADCFRFLRFFQREFTTDLTVPRALVAALEKDAALRADYEKVIAFYAKLTNPYVCRSLLDIDAAPEQVPLATHDAVALLPPSTSRETVLFKKLFPTDLPPEANLMRELIRVIRSGSVDLRPTAKSGWYEHQVYALETLLLPEKGEENPKLLLTKTYKKRMLEAFKALMTKRRETHVRQLTILGLSTCQPPVGEARLSREIKPRLRVEPCPSYFLRTARAYNFLANFLEASVGDEGLRSLHGLLQGGEREPNLHGELHFMRDLFYGLYLVSAEDIGLKPDLAKGELDDEDRCYRLAVDWLPKALTDRDIAADTRVMVPIARVL